MGREALVVGVNAYDQGPLRNCVNDATDVAAALGRLGFRTLLETDCGLDAFERAIVTFNARIKLGTVAVFYFSGHGCEHQSHNYLLPRGFVSGTADTALRRRAIAAQEVLDGMRVRESGINIVILDACRSHRGVARTARDPAPGLFVMIPPEMREGGTFIAYATAPNAVSYNGYGRGGRNGLYTSHLLRFIEKPGLRVQDMLNEVQFSVSEATFATHLARQKPWVNTN
jgi:uncharacterized caspase-like protein